MILTYADAAAAVDAHLAVHQDSAALPLGSVDEAPRLLEVHQHRVPVVIT